jgi:DnaJ-class molecular chaperone
MKECEECHGSGYVVDLRRDNEQEIWRWSNKRPCPKCSKTDDLHNADHDGY